MRALLLLLLLLLLSISGCANVNGRGAAEPLVRAHAESDLDCPGAEIRVSEELGGRYKAIGCGRKAYYRTACDGLSCVVEGGEGPMVPWKDRPEPGTRTAP
jgi:hypothetical protein